MPESLSENGLNIRLYDNKDTVNIDIYQDNTISHKVITLSDLEKCFFQSQETDQMCFNGLLPSGILSYSVSATETYVVLRYPEQKITYSYTYSDSPYLSFPMPNLIFGILLNKEHMVLRTLLRVIPQGALSLDSPLYYYPLSNVHDNGEICMGRNEALIYDNLQALENYPQYVLSLPNNNDLFNSAHNKRRLEHKKLLDTLAKRNPDYYYNHILVQVPGQTLKDFCTLGGKIK